MTALTRTCSGRRDRGYTRRPPLRQHIAPGRIPMQRLDSLWSTQGATKPEGSGIGLSECRVSRNSHTVRGKQRF
jgi:hypothetical protein